MNVKTVSFLLAMVLVVCLTEEGDAFTAGVKMPEYPSGKREKVGKWQSSSLLKIMQGIVWVTSLFKSFSAPDIRIKLSNVL